MSGNRKQHPACNSPDLNDGEGQKSSPANGFFQNQRDATRIDAFSWLLLMIPQNGGRNTATPFGKTKKDVLFLKVSFFRQQETAAQVNQQIDLF